MTNDVTVWSPIGRIPSDWLPWEAVKRVLCNVGISVPRTHAVSVAQLFQRASSELSSHQKKIIPIDDHIGISIAGLTSDARMLSKFMRTECLNSRYAYETPLPVSRLVSEIGNSILCCIGCVRGREEVVVKEWDPGKRSVDHVRACEMGPHIFQTCPSANYFDCKCMAIGARSQSARTYLEKKIDDFQTGLIQELLGSQREWVNSIWKNCSVAIVGKDEKFTVYEDDDVAKFLAGIETEARSRGRRAPDAASMDTDAPAAPAAEGDPAPATGSDQPMEH
eukprot:XP_011670621.1 PREDICTED: proteasome subunit alpha type-1-like [Strongylocentrotus purpuratus]